jgi:L-iditol 2-dehydrogenase
VGRQYRIIRGHCRRESITQHVGATSTPPLLFYSLFPGYDCLLLIEPLSIIPTESQTSNADICRIPSHITLTTAALLEPLSVAIHSTNRAAILPGHTALVIGAGTVGLLTAAMCLQSGCSAVTIADISAPRVAFATEKGFATHGFVVPRTDSATASASTSGTSTPSSTSSAASSVISSVIMSPLSRYADIQVGLQVSKELAADMLALTQPPGSYDEECDPGFDVVFECTGAESCMQTSLYAARPGGRVVMVGMGTPIQTLPLSAAHLREVDIVGIFRYANTYPQALAMVASGRLKGIDGLVTHRIRGLERVGEAMETAIRGIGGDGELVLKVVIEN